MAGSPDAEKRRDPGLVDGFIGRSGVTEVCPTLSADIGLFRFGAQGWGNQEVRRMVILGATCAVVGPRTSVSLNGWRPCRQQKNVRPVGCRLPSTHRRRGSEPPASTGWHDRHCANPRSVRGWEVPLV